MNCHNFEASIPIDQSSLNIFSFKQNLTECKNCNRLTAISILLKCRLRKIPNYWKKNDKINSVIIEFTDSPFDIYKKV